MRSRVSRSAASATRGSTCSAASPGEPHASQPSRTIAAGRQASPTYLLVIVQTPSQSSGGGLAMKCSVRST
jgi:hypothetical protein